MAGEAAIYLTTLALFSYIVSGSALLRHEMLILVCIPPVFVALIVGFVMALYAGETFGTLPTLAAAAAGMPPGWWAARSLRARGLLISIYLAWGAAMLCALAAFRFPDHP